jgi:hypothetical protein
LKRLAVGAFVFFAIVLAAFFIAIDRVAGAAIEKGASYALGVDTTVGFARIGLLTGSFHIRRLEIDNPPGFDADHLIALGSARLTVATASLSEPRVEIPLMEFESVKVALEKNRGESNFSRVLRNLGRFESSGEPGSRGNSGATGKRFVIGEIVIRDVTAHVEHTEVLGSIGAIDVVVPEVRLRDVGGRNANGVNLSELTDIVVKAVFSAILKNGANLPKAVVGELHNGLGDLVGVPIQIVGSAAAAVTEKLPGGVTKSVQKLGGRAGDAGKKALDGVSGLFRRRNGGE